MIIIQPGLIKEHIELFNKQEKDKEDVLKICFKRKDTLDDVLVQVFMLNYLYGTCIDPAGLRQVAEFIYRENVIDKIIDGVSKDIESKSNIVEEIAGCGERHTVSFASKYCNWICKANCGRIKETYPILDRYSRGMIWTISKELLKKEETKSAYYDYAYFFKSFVVAHKEYASEYSYKDFDKYLWLYGKSKGIYIE